MPVEHAALPRTRFPVNVGVVPAVPVVVLTCFSPPQCRYDLDACDIQEKYPDLFQVNLEVEVEPRDRPGHEAPPWETASMRGLNPKILFSSREEQQDILSKFGEILVFWAHLQVAQCLFLDPKPRGLQALPGSWGGAGTPGRVGFESLAILGGCVFWTCVTFERDLEEVEASIGTSWRGCPRSRVCSWPAPTPSTRRNSAGLCRLIS